MTDAMEPINVQGLDLKIDSAIQQICEASNKSSSNSRNVLYAIVLTVIISIISVVNTFDLDTTVKYVYKHFHDKERQMSSKPTLLNWTQLRIEQDMNDINHYKLLLAKAKKSHKQDSINEYQDLLNIAKSSLLSDTKNKIENTRIIKVPIIGNSFDINNLGFVTGATFCILLFMLRLTVIRELNNLKIALQSITERYPSDANWNEFSSIINNEKTIERKNNLLYCINFTRRQHHYNFLSMNEIYTIPPLETGDYKLGSLAQFTIKYIFFLPFIPYIIVIVNDLMTFNIGWNISPTSTLVLFSQECFFGVVIWFLCRQCTSLKTTVDNLYTEFKNNQYQYFRAPE